MTTKATILKIIRRKCIDCCVGQVREVRLCAAKECDLWPFRFGMDPDPSKTGFAKNPSCTRGVLSGKAATKRHSSPNNFAPEEREGLCHD